MELLKLGTNETIYNCRERSIISKEKPHIMEHKSSDYENYKDAIAHIDCAKYIRRLGFSYSDRARLWLVKDICGIICAFFTWFLIMFAEFVVVFVILKPTIYTLHNTINCIIFHIFLLGAFGSHLKTMLSDPGAVPRGNATKDNIAKLCLKEGQVVYKCPKCISIKPDRAHHCSVCRRCVRKMDHHCPWVNNCVGECNQKFFVLFTFYICMMSIHALYLSIRHFVVCLGREWSGCSYFSPAATTVFLIFLLFEALLFGLFTAIMCGTQLSAICTDETGIEQLKKETARWERKSKWLSLKAVFGHPFSYRWFSPLHSPTRSNEVFYYEV